MKIYKVTQDTDIINYQPIEKNYSKFYQENIRDFQYGLNYEKLFVSKKDAEQKYNEILKEIKVGADEMINISGITYFVKNIWEKNGEPYKEIKSVRMRELNVNE